MTTAYPNNKTLITTGGKRLSAELEERCKSLLLELGIMDPAQKVSVSSLTGGVASDIALVKVGERKYCAKFALPKLKVAVDWFAPVHRNAAEYQWLQVAARIAPESAIQLFGRSESMHGFVMEFVEGKDVFIWKTQLLNEMPQHEEAAQVGSLVGQVHAASTQSSFNRQPFYNAKDFVALRIEPYITYTATKHKDIADKLRDVANWLSSSQQVLVHGDVSPKNILFRSTGPVVLDAECATMGDASFDPAFCMNHLVLKAIHLPNSRQQYLRAAKQFWDAYAPNIMWEDNAAVEQRVCQLLPVLMLGRVDGRSPVEYLSDQERTTVRKIARRFVLQPTENLRDLMNGIDDALREFQA